MDNANAQPSAEPKAEATNTTTSTVPTASTTPTVQNDTFSTATDESTDDLPF